MKITNLLLLLLCLISGCQTEEEALIFDYHPTPINESSGVVNKYYDHFYPKDRSSEVSTNVSYVLIRKKSANSFKQETYNAGFELIDVRDYLYGDGVLYLESRVSFYGLGSADTVVSEIIQPAFQTWTGSPETGLVEKMDFDGDKYEIDKTQQAVRDSTILEKPAKIFRGVRTVTSINRDTVFNYDYVAIYAKDLGLFNSLTTRPNGNSVSELVEQIPYDKFQELANHTKKRVAYIDPEETLDKNENFKICGPEQKIADYYNSNPDGRYSKGKGEMMKILRPKMSREHLKGESGYLTFRFVVNCEGKAGRFVIEQTDLDYQPKYFKSGTINYLYDLTKSLESWSPTVIRGEPRDSYFYLTYKLQNGVLTDVLP